MHSSSHWSCRNGNQCTDSVRGGRRQAVQEARAHIPPECLRLRRQFLSGGRLRSADVHPSARGSVRTLAVHGTAQREPNLVRKQRIHRQPCRHHHRHRVRQVLRNTI